MIKTLGNKIPGLVEATNYRELLQAFPPRPIQSETELNAIQEVIDFLMDKPYLMADDRDYLHLLGLLVAEYEEKHYPIPEISGSEVLQMLMEQQNRKPKDLIPIFASEAAVTAVLQNEQEITLQQIYDLAKFFHVAPAVFL